MVAFKLFSGSRFNAAHLAGLLKPAVRFRARVPCLDFVGLKNWTVLERIPQIEATINKGFPLSFVVKHHQTISGAESTELSLSKLSDFADVSAAM